MIFNNRYWLKVMKNILYVILSLIIVYIICKLSVFYIPFLVAFIISLILEPLIKLIMKKIKLTRRASSIIIFIAFSIIIFGLLIFGITTIITESSHLLESLNTYIDKAYELFKSIIDSLNFEKINLPTQTKEIIENSFTDLLKQFVEWARGRLTGVIEGIAHVPRIFLQFTITLIALYFMCVDKIYIIDQLEHHMPKKWIRKIQLHFREITKSLGGYLKAQVLLIFISFVISVIGLYLFKMYGFTIKYPLLIAVGIGFIDALPVLGSGSVMVPWAIVCALNGNIPLRDCNYCTFDNNVGYNPNVRA